jgi:pimeloyl-ACP methyl ester carboxylesterase
MGGPVAMLLARDHPAAVSGLVLCATSGSWTGARMRAVWRTMGLLRLGLGVFPVRGWDLLLAPVGVPEGPMRSWLAAELERGSTVDIAEAGRELGRFDAGPWAPGLRDRPCAVIVTARDRSVPPARQRELASALGARVLEVEADHLAVVANQAPFRAALLEALSGTRKPEPGRAVA